MIYLDNAATTIHKPEQVREKIVDALEMGNPGRGFDGPSKQGLKEMYFLREKLARLFGIESSSQVILTPGITWSLNLVIRSLIGKGDHVLTTVMEHNSVLRPLFQREKEGAKITFLPMDGEAPRLTESALTSRTRFLVISAASNVTGFAPNLLEAAGFAEDHELILIVDGAQALGTIPQEIGKCSRIIYGFTGHKGLYGPMGTGGLLLQGEFPFTPVFSGGTGVRSFLDHQPEDIPTIFEPGTPNLPGFAGLSGALDTFDPQIHSSLEEKRSRLEKGLRLIPRVKVFSGGPGSAPVLSLAFSTMDSGTAAMALWDKGKIVTRPGAHCAPLLHRHFHTEDSGLLRLSLSRYTTNEELDFTLNLIESLA